MRELKLSWSYEQVLVRRSNVSRARLHDLPMFRLLYLDLHGAAQKVRNPTLMPRGDMLDDHDAAGKFAGQLAKHVHQGIQPASRSADRHNVVTTLGVVRRLLFASSHCGLKHIARMGINESILD